MFGSLSGYVRLIRLVIYRTFVAGPPRGPAVVFPAATMDAMSRALDQLESTIAERKAAGDGNSSYTAKLLAGGVAKIGQKIIEEAAEVVEAAGEPGAEGRQHTIAEAGDVLYHLLVLLAAHDIALAEVEQELARRFGMSGLEEKASRQN